MTDRTRKEIAKEIATRCTLVMEAYAVMIDDPACAWPMIQFWSELLSLRQLIDDYEAFLKRWKDQSLNLDAARERR